jgi:tetratricopeptide (TPR) repeat protein
MDSRLSRWLDGLLEACWLAAIVVTPLFFNIHSERVFEPDKIALLRSLALLMAAAWVVKVVDQQAWRHLDQLRPSHPESIWRRPFALVVILLLTVYLLSTLLSVVPYTSWAGSYQRLQGTYTMLSYVVIFALMATIIRDRSQIRRVVTVAIITSIPVAFYGLLQHFGLDPLPWGGDVTERVAGHMGNAIFIAAYLIMIVPLTVSRIINAFSDILTRDELSVADVVRSSIYIFALAIQLLTIYWSGSRGPLIGLGVGLFAFTLVLLVSLRDVAPEQRAATAGRVRRVLPALALLSPAVLALLLSKPVSDATSPLVAFLFFMGTVALSAVAVFLMVAMGRGWQWLWLGWILLTGFAGLWLLAFNIQPGRTAAVADVPVLGGVVQVMDEWRELPTIGSFGRMLDATATAGRKKSGRVRVLIWEGALDLISPHSPLVYPDGSADPFNFLRPIIGYGPESMYVAYNRFYPAELATVEARNASPDRSHNETFDALVITGWLGFLAWQAVYLSVIYFAFRYLGVIRSRRDTWVFIGLLVGGALLGALVVLLLAEGIYLGVAVPTGVMAGVIFYLIYYALFSETHPAPADVSERLWPFAADRLLMNALVAAVLAHYVEIHFGIAISATRLMFFVYVALMVALAYGLPRLATTAEPAPAAVSTAKGRRKPKSVVAATTPPLLDHGWNQIILVGLLLVLALSVMGYSFITYALPPGKVITGLGDLSTLEIFRQSLLQNAQRDFAGSPFVFAMFILTWGLGWLIALSEMAKHGELPFALGAVTSPTSRARLAGGAFMVMGLAAVAARFLLAAPADATGLLGRSLLLVWGIVSLIAGAVLLLGRDQATAAGGLTAVAGLALSPALLAGGAVAWGVGLAAVCGAILFLLWQPAWRHSLLPLAGVVGGSLIAGLLYTLWHAARFRASLFFQPPADVTSMAELRGLEALGIAGLLSGLYVFIFLLILLMAVAIAWSALAGRGGGRPWANTPLTIAALAIVMGGALFLIATTNLRVIQADMIFKRGRPFDDQATRSGQADPEATRAAWDAAIAVYDQAIARAPREDYYYLFLGRALLERSGAAGDALDRLAYLQEAEARLLEARSLNPLNTDHTANLARLYTRWSGVVPEGPERDTYVQLGEQYYQQALGLSPQNSIIRNEYARLALELNRDCAQALALLDESVTVDPFYTLSWLSRADAYVLCGRTLPEPSRTQHFETAAASLQTALGQQPDNVRAWVQLAGVWREIGRHAEALDAVAQARLANTNGQFPENELDFIEARNRAALGETDDARALAQQALTTADPDLATQIEAFLAELEAGASPN